MINRNNLPFMKRSKVVLMLQTEGTECGLACLGMIASFYGQYSDIASLRRINPVSAKGATLKGLMQIAKNLGLSTRPVALDLAQIKKLRLPCILHWNFNHFVVLQKISNERITVLDPAKGSCDLTLDEVSDSFTGVALELWPDTNFKTKDKPARIKIRTLLGGVVGVNTSLLQIFFLAIALELTVLLAPFFLQWVVDSVLISSDINLLNTLSIGFGGLAVMQQLFVAARSWAIMCMSTSINIQWRANVFSHLLSLPVSYFERRHLGDVVSRFGSIESIEQTLTGTFIETILDGVMSLIVLVMMYFYNPSLAAIAVVTVVIYVGVRIIWFTPLKRSTEARLVHAAKQQSHLLESMRGIKAIKLFQRDDIRHATWSALLINQVNSEFRTKRLELAYKTLNGLLFGVEGIVTVWIGASYVLSGNFTLGMLTAFLAYKLQFTTRIVGFIDKIFEFRMLRVQGERLADIVLTEKDKTRGTSEIGSTEDLEASIEVKQLSFSYSPQEPMVLKSLAFKINPGESVCIVGPSGGGKSTLVSLLLGILAPTNGEIFVGGVSIKTAGIGTLRSMIGTVMQDDVLFAGSIADNISFFDLSVDTPWVYECAFNAGVLDEINLMPMGFNTLVGDMGSVLSGGQKQRILLARALYKRPKILLLDEATSHLDVLKESQVNDTIKKLAMTKIMIAHRPETIASADRVLQLVNGTIEETSSIGLAA